MKNLLTYFKYAACAFAFAACSNDLDTVDTYKDIPVIYGFLNIGDTATYIRVERAFVDETKPAETLMQIADSLYYNDAKVVLVQGTRRYTLTAVNGDTEGYPRAAGAFAKSPNRLYKIKNTSLPLQPGQEWTIEISRGTSEKVIASATTKVVGSYDFVAPFEDLLPTWSYTNQIAVRTESVNAEQNGRVYDLKLLFTYEETAANGTKKDTTVKWDFAKGQIRKLEALNRYEEIVQFSQSGRSFFEFLGNTIPVNSSVSRKFKKIDLELYVGGVELADNLTIGSVNLGITGSQAIPVYTNVKNGYGVFSSRAKIVRTGYIFNDPTLETLKTGELTRNLSFR